MKEFYKYFVPIWDGYEVGKFLGSGSYGDVWELNKIGSNNSVAEVIKQIQVPPETAGGIDEALLQGLDIEGAKYYYQGMKQRALDEVNMMRTLLDYPNIVHFYDHKIYNLTENEGEYGWILFIRMERLQSFKDKLKRDGITVEEIVHLGIDLCSALEACQNKGIIHRDIKPENIFYSKEKKIFKLGDFGISCYLSRPTEVKGLAGTLTHMSPEIYNGGEYTYMGDLYAVGMVLYKLLNDNRIPFLNEYPEPYSPNMRDNALQRRLKGEEIELPSIVHNYNSVNHPSLKIDSKSERNVMSLAEIVTKSISSKPDKRYKTARELKEELIKLT
jgi:serine/threonine protein kinase